MKRQVLKRRAPTSGERRTVTAAVSHESVSLDDRPLAIVVTRDQRRLLVVLPHEVWVVGAATLEIERSIEVAAAEPSVCEAAREGQLWIGGHHLHYGSIFATTHSKIGSKLGGFVDRLCLLRPSLLCGAGSQGEILWDVDKESAIHRRKTSEHRVHALVACGDKAVWADGSSSAWVIHPDHPSGYMQLALRATSPDPVESEGIIALGTTTTGRCVLAARDGAIAWTNKGLRIDGERHPKTGLRQAEPLAVAGDERWIYVLRPRGLLQRFLIEQPKIPPGDDETQPLPEAQECRLRWPASALVLVRGEVRGEPASTLVVGGPQAEGLLGRLWRVEPESLEWRPLALGQRALAEAAPPAASDPRAPNFTPTRSKISGSPLAELKVDHVLAPRETVLITVAHGSLLERPVGERPAAEVMPADTVILPAMLRFREGTARPGLVLWPGVSDPEREPPEPIWLCWGDSPRGWMPLTTPKIREQGWSRPDLFPLQIAVAALPQVAGNRQALNERWLDPELFGALARECKRLLKVIW